MTEKAQRCFYQSMGKLKRTEQNLIVRIGNSEAEVTNTKRRHSRYCTVEANYRRTQSILQPVCDSRGA